MAGKKKAPVQKSIMDQLSEYSPPWQDDERVEKNADPNAGLVERLAKLEGELAEARRQQTYQSFTQAPASTQEKVEKKETYEIDLKGLPDPVSHPNEYSAEYTKRLQASFDKKLEAAQAQQAQQAEQATLAQRVWDGYKTAQPDWAKHELLVQAAANKISVDMVGKGVDMVKLLKQQPDLFYGEVTSLLEKQYPQLKASAEGTESDAGDDSHRTAGVFGGTPGKASAGADTAGQPDENDNFLRSMAEMRYKAGVR